MDAQISPWLPKTVKDKDGVERKLLGVLVSEPVFDDLGNIDFGKIVMFVEDEPAPPSCERRGELRAYEMNTYMRVHCPICRAEMDGMKGYGREARCCCKECYEEWEWRRILAIMGKEYRPKKTPAPSCDGGASEPPSEVD